MRSPNTALFVFIPTFTYHRARHVARNLSFDYGEEAKSTFQSLSSIASNVSASAKEPSSQASMNLPPTLCVQNPRSSNREALNKAAIKIIGEDSLL